MAMRKFHEDGTLPEKGEIWVFGSNLAGRHGAGAAQVAHEQFEYPMGLGIGPHGRCYAIPTKDHQLNVLPLHQIREWVNHFIWYTAQHEETEFWVTAIGCGYAGYKPAEIAPLFGIAPLRNCNFPDTWQEVLGE